MLTPGTKLNRETDEYMDVVGGDKDFYSLMGVEDLEQDTVCGTEGLFFRRPIPPHILDNQAFWVMFDTLAEIPAYGVGGWLLELERGITDFGDIRVLIHNVRGLFYGHSRRFRTKDDAENAIEFLGGQNRIIKELEVGRLYDKWLLEQIESGG